MQVRIPLRHVTLVLLTFALFLCAASVTGQAIEYVMGSRGLPGLNTFNSLFHMDREFNVASWYSSGALLLGSLLAGVIAAAGGQNGIRGYRHFAALSILFLLMSLEETVGLHERLIRPLSVALRPTGYLRFGWMIVGIPIVLVVGMAFVPLLLSLPRRIAFLFVAAGALFVSGAIGMEMVGGAVYDLDGWASPRYQAIIHFEELMEMVGVIVSIYALGSVIELMEPRLSISFSEGRDDAHAPGAVDSRDRVGDLESRG